MADAFTNFAKSTLAGGLAPATTALTVQVGDGALFPAAGAGQTFRCVLQNLANQREVILVSVRAGDAFTTIVRAQEGTTALTWNAGDKIGHRLTAAQLNNILVSSDLQQNTKTWCGTAGGTANALTLTPTPAVIAMAAGHKFIFKTGAAANTTPVTIAVSGLAPFAAQNSGAALGAGDVAANSWYEVLYDGAAGQLKKYTLGAPLNTKGDLHGFSTTDTRVAVGGDNTVLGPDSTVATGLAYVNLGSGAVRQSVLAASLDATGYNNAITTGAGLRPGLSATTTPYVLAFASGFGTRGSQDFVSRLTADVADILAANLPLSNTSFVHSTYTSSSAVTWSSCLVPPQYGYAFDRSKQALLNFEGVNGATTTTDDFGNTWTMTTATISTAQFKFGTSSLKTNSGYVESSSFTSLGDGSWEMSVWVRYDALPTAGQFFPVLNAGNPSGFGIIMSINNTAGTIKSALWLSSNGTSHDLTSTLLGTNTVWAINTQYRFRFVFDALAGNYKLYLSIGGAAETLDSTVASASKLCLISKIRLGLDVGATQTAWTGYIDAFRFLQCATNTTTETPSVTAPAIGDHPVHFFSISEMKMYEATAASAVAGTNPTLTQRSRLFVAEADTSGAAVTAVRNYALRGQYVSDEYAATSGAVTSKNHNIGTKPKQTSCVMVCKTADLSYVPGDEKQALDPQFDSDNHGVDIRVTRNTISSVVATGALSTVNATTFALGSPTTANWKLRLEASRGW